MISSRAVRKLRSRIDWFPPAESKIPISQILRCLLPIRKNLSEELKRFIGPRSFRLANSGRSLLYGLLQALKQQAGEQRNEVLVPGYTCYSVAAAIVKAGLNISVYDLAPQNFNPDLDTLRKSATEKTLAILTQHLFGIPASIGGVAEIAKEIGAVHIEDAAQALGGYDGSKALGLKGDFGLFSFGRGKPLPLGCGGMLIANKGNFAPYIDPLNETKDLSRLVLTAVTQIISKPMLYGIAEALPLELGQTHFDPSFKISGIPKIIQRLLTNTLGGLEEMNRHRRSIADVYRQNFKPNLTFDEPGKGLSVYTRFPLRVPNNRIPVELKQRGVRRMYPEALVDEKKIRPYLSQPNADTPGSRQVARMLITLPTHFGMKKHGAVLTARLIKDLMIT